jgi:hypothetical protein
VLPKFQRFIIAKSFGSLTPDELPSDKRCPEESTAGSGSDFASISSDSDRSSPSIFNAAWDVASSSMSGFTWSDLAFTITQAGAVLGTFRRTTAYVGLLVSSRIMPSLSLSVKQFEFLHAWVTGHPFRLLVKCFDVLGINSKELRRLASFLDLPVLFFPFMNKSFYFSSALVAPQDIDGQRYAVSCVSASHDFIQQNSRCASTSPVGHLGCMKIGGSTNSHRSDGVLWGITQPEGNFLVRLSSFLLARLFRTVFTEVTMDLASFFQAFEDAKQEKNSLIILVPTRRSFLDQYILGHSLFSFPECGLPATAATDGFPRVPAAGCLFQSLGGIFGRGWGEQSKHQKREPQMDAVFRRLETSNTDKISRIKSNVVLVPVTISYDRTPEEQMFAQDECGLSQSLGLGGFIKWIMVRSQYRQDCEL